MHPVRGLAAFPQNIVCTRNFCNNLRPNAPTFVLANSRYNEAVTKKFHQAPILLHWPHF